MVLNGSEFRLLKLVQDRMQYDLSNLFSLLNRGNDLYSVLRILKRVGLLMTMTPES
jgi:hypothetical protein